jgi:hypothetical protein
MVPPAIDVLAATQRVAELSTHCTWWLDGSRRALPCARPRPHAPGILTGSGDTTVVFALLVSTSIPTLVS